VDNDTLEVFAGLFQGRTDVWGSVRGRCNKEPVTIENYRQHLAGKTSLGVYPLLDDGSCRFAAIDLDEKNFDKALAIRQELYNLFIPAYIAQSKGKGFHIYVFALEPFKASQIRQVLQGVLTRLNITAEIFPKQDATDEVTPYGNYINLPCFGHTRPFLTKSLNEVAVSDLGTKIKYVPAAAVDKAVALVPKAEAPLKAQAPRKTHKGRSKKAPPCIERILAGVNTPGRDVAAFALARHYLDQLYLPEEVLALLTIWDRSNTPPLKNEKLLEEKVRSAAKGYAFGCKSILDSPLLADFCPGQDKCDWLKRTTSEKKKQGLIKELTAWENETTIYEQVVKDGHARFLAYEKATKEISVVQQIETPDFVIVPIHSAEITEGAVIMPDGADEYGNTLQLIDDIREHIRTYDDIPDAFLEFATWYIMMSWVHDRLSTVSYLRFTGDTGTGKSRSLDIIGRLCYKPMMLSGAVTPAPIYRLIRRFRGTLVLDEADFRDSSEKSEVVTILNCGFERGRPVIRCSKDDPNNLEILPCFGPKVFATRYTFADVALEARCLTHCMEETDRDDIPAILGNSYRERERVLRNRLLLWRFHNLTRIDPEAGDEIELGHLEPRLKQTSIPYAIPFKDMPEVMERFKAFLQHYQSEIIKVRGESEAGRIIFAIFKAATNPEVTKQWITSSIISNVLLEEFKIQLDASKIGRTLRSLNIKVERRRNPAQKLGRYMKWENRLMRKLLRRYVVDSEDYSSLVEEELLPASQQAEDQKVSIDTSF